MTKEVHVILEGSWQFPYLITVPFNTLLSFAILYSMFGWMILFCYASMVGLLLLQYVSNK